MMSWSPTARRNGMSGAVHLFSRQEWRDSAHGAKLEQIVRLALGDEDEVNRLHAAYAVRSLEPATPAALELLRERLLTEPNNDIAAVLTNQLAELAQDAPAEVDSIVDELMTSSAWQSRLASDDHDRLDLVDPLVSLVLWLAIAQQTPAATALCAGWFSHPVERPVTQRAVWMLRRWLALSASHAAERHRAFVLAKTAAQGLEALRLTARPTDVGHLYRTAAAVADQVYFASGAFGAADSNDEPVPAQDGFAVEAFAVLECLTEFKDPSIAHHLVETLAHLSPSAPGRAFLLIERTISTGDPYTFDSLAADTAVALIERYLAEFRDILISDPEVLTAVRRVLEAFVRVGWPAAVALSYRLGDAFR